MYVLKSAEAQHTHSSRADIPLVSCVYGHRVTLAASNYAHSSHTMSPPLTISSTFSQMRPPHDSTSMIFATPARIHLFALCFVFRLSVKTKPPDRCLTSSRMRFTF